MASRAVRVDILGDASGLSRAASEAENSLKGVGERAKTTHEGLMGLGKAAGAAFLGVGVVESLKGMVDKAVEAQATVARLATALRNTGQATEANKKAIEGYEEAQRRRGFTDEQTNDALSREVVATHSVTEALGLNNLAANIAAARHIDLSQAVGIAIKAHEGNTRVLKQLGIVIQPVTTAQDALKASTEKYTKAQMDAAKASDKAATTQAGLNAVMQATHGQADAFASTDAGKMATFRAEWEHLQETIGQKVLPVVTSVMDKIESMMQFISEHQAVFKTLAEVVGGVAVALGTYKAAAEVATIAQAALNTEMELNPIGLVVTALAALAIGLKEAWDHSKTFRDIASDAFNVVKASVEPLIVTVQGLAHAIEYVISLLPSLPFSGSHGFTPATVVGGKNTPAGRGGLNPALPPGKQTTQEFDEEGRLRVPWTPARLAGFEGSLGRSLGLRQKQSSFAAEQAARAHGETDASKIMLIGQKAADLVDLKDLRRRDDAVKKTLKTNLLQIQKVQSALAAVKVPHLIAASGSQKGNADEVNKALAHRQKLRDQLRALRDERSSLIAEHADLAAQAAELGFDISQIDLEAAGGLPTQFPATPATDTTTTAPMPADTSSPASVSSPAAVSPDTQAALDQAIARATAATQSAATANAFIQTAFGSGDIGAGGLNAFGATFIQNVNTLHPGDPGTLLAIAQAAAAGFGFQGYVPASSGAAGI